MVYTQVKGEAKIPCRSPLAPLIKGEPEERASFWSKPGFEVPLFKGAYSPLGIQEKGDRAEFWVCASVLVQDLSKIDQRPNSITP